MENTAADVGREIISAPVFIWRSADNNSGTSARERERMNSRARKSDLLFDRISRAQPTTSGAYIRASPPVAINKFADALASACSA